MITSHCFPERLDRAFGAIIQFVQNSQIQIDIGKLGFFEQFPQKGCVGHHLVVPCGRNADIIKPIRRR